jgi:hypothetical protein
VVEPSVTARELEMTVRIAARWIVLGGLTAFIAAWAKRADAQGTTANHVEPDSTEMRVLAALSHSGWRVDGRLCFDAAVAPERARAANSPALRWSEHAVREILRNETVSLDTSASTAAIGQAVCSRSTEIPRVSFGRPQITGASGTVRVLVTRLDERARPDTFWFEYMAQRVGDTWTVDPRFDSETTHIDVDAVGCYRFSHAPFTEKYNAGWRIDTVVVRADSTLLGQSWRGFPARRLSPDVGSVGMPDARSGAAYWFVTHTMLHLVWESGFVSLSADLDVRGDSLSGSMRLESDAVVPNRPQVAVTGRRVPCRER